jgi:hypothetical protein
MPGGKSRPGSAGDNGPMSEPRPMARTSLSGLDPNLERPARVQMIVVLLLVLVLVVIPLYLWRRPRAESIAAGGPSAAPAETVSPPPVTSTTPGEEKVTVGDVHVLSCHDPGSRKTAREQCDRVTAVEQAFAKAVEESASCVPKEAGGGTIQYVADVSFKRKGASVTTPKDGRNLKNTKAVAACHSAVKARLSALALDGVPHQHQRYKLSVTATYPGPVKP